MTVLELLKQQLEIARQNQLTKSQLHNVAETYADEIERTNFFAELHTYVEEKFTLENKCP